MSEQNKQTLKAFPCSAIVAFAAHINYLVLLLFVPNKTGNIKHILCFRENGYQLAKVPTASGKQEMDT